MQTRSVDLHRIAALAQATEQRLRQRPITQKALPFGVARIRGDDGGMTMMLPLFYELEQDIGLLWFGIDVAELIDR